MKTRPKLILLSGWAGSGKDSVADYLVTAHGYQKLSFAKVLKDMVAEQYGVERAAFDDREKKESPLLNYPVVSKDSFSKYVNEFMRGEHKPYMGELYHTPRSLCILEGSIKRSVDANYWVKRAASQMKPGQAYVIADWRYKSEYEAIAALGLEPITIRINRFETTASVDPSERDLDAFSFKTLVSNSGTKEELFEKVRQVCGL